MPVENYKKWTILVIIIAVAALVAIAVMTSSPDKTNNVPADTGQASTPSVPLIEKDIGQASPLEDIDLDNQSPQAIAALGDRYFEERNFRQAIKLYEKALELNPDDIDTYNDLGLAYHYTKQSASAVEILKKGAELNPSYQRIWISLGFVQMSTGQKEEAMLALKKAVDLNPDNEVGIEAQKMLDSLR